jgi:protein phosphatase 1G
LFGRPETDNIALYTGCTACVALITENEIICANAGDSRCVLSNNGTAVELSIDHKPDLSTEKARIERAGGFVEENRVKGVLNLSRSLGDLEYKQDKNIGVEA